MRSYFGEYHPTISKGMNIFGNEQEVGKEKGGKDHEVGLNEKGEMPCGVIIRMGDRPDGALPLFIGGGDQLCW